MKLLKDSTLESYQDKIKTLEVDVLAGENNFETLTESVRLLELALEDLDWNKLDSTSNAEFNKASRKRINELARLYWLKNPLIRRAVLTQSQYVFSGGINISSEDDRVNEVIQSFLDNELNKVELTDHQTRMVKEDELQLFANIYFVFFVNKLDGEVVVRTIPVDEIDEIITDQDDNKKPLYYKRVYNVSEYSFKSGSYTGTKEKTSYYRDWRNEKESKIKIKGLEEPVIYHIAVNKLSDMKFGVSEVYSAIDWAKAYKEFLEDWATIVKAYSKFAWNLTSKNKTGMARAKAKLNTTLSSTNTETNPSPPAGSIFQNTEGSKLEPIKTSGATTKAEDGDKLVHMVSAATGIFYHYLVGDPSTGNLATAKSLEKPMEIMFKNRQQFWKDVYTNILNFVIDANIEASGGKLKKNVDRLLNVSFPDILEKDITTKVDAIIKAATLDGKQLSGMIGGKVVAKALLEALGFEKVDEMIEKDFKDGQPVQGLQQKMDESFTKIIEVMTSLKVNGNGK